MPPTILNTMVKLPPTPLLRFTQVATRFLLRQVDPLICFYGRSFSFFYLDCFFSLFCPFFFFFLFPSFFFPWSFSVQDVSSRARSYEAIVFLRLCLDNFIPCDLVQLASSFDSIWTPEQLYRNRLHRPSIDPGNSNSNRFECNNAGLAYLRSFVPLFPIFGHEEFRSKL